MRSFTVCTPPHNKLIAPESKPAQIVNLMEASKIAPIMDVYVDEFKAESQLSLVNILGSIDRKKSGQVLDLMKDAASALNLFNDSYSLDLLFYVDRSTYARISNNINALPIRINKLTDQAILADIAKTDSDSKAKTTSCELIHNIKEERLMTDHAMLEILRELCDEYSKNREYTRLEPIATRIGEELNQRGGIGEMRRIFALLNGCKGSRTLEMHWSGIGDWQG